MGASKISQKHPSLSLTEQSAHAECVWRAVVFLNYTHFSGTAIQPNLYTVAHTHTLMFPLTFTDPHGSSE